MSLFNADRLCLLCSYRSIELKQFGKVREGEINAKTHQKTNTGLICTKCNGFVCLDCIKVLVPAMLKDSKHFISTSLVDSYIKAIASLPNKFVSPSTFIGHCCIIDRPTDISPASPLLKDDDLHCKNHSNVGRLSGCIFFPEFDIFIDSPMDCMDIHAVGAEYDYSVNEMKRSIDGKPSPRSKNFYLDARWHCVIPHEYAVLVNDMSPIANEKIPTTWNECIFRKIRIKSPHNRKIMKNYSIRLIHIEKKNSFDYGRKSTNLPTAKELKDGYLFERFGPFQLAPDVTLIIGSDEVGTHASILLCRFHNLSPSLTEIEKEDLFGTIWSCLKPNKFECRRSGGSSGMISDQPDNLIKKFITNPGSCPRNGKGTVWIRGVDTWYLYYIGTYHGKLKTCKYTNPVPGGSFHFESRCLKKYRFLCEFISIKPITALIIDSLQARIMKKEGFKVCITPQAVRAELMNIAETQQVILCSQTGNKDKLPLDLEIADDGLLGTCPFLAFYTVYNRDHVKFTMVCHAVGLHLDSFSQKIPSLENKICFEMLNCRIPESALINSHPHGRGGGSTSLHFVFALLDWSSKQRSRRQVWTDPANSHLPNAPTNTNDHLTQVIWNAFYQVDRVTVARGINVDNL